MSKDELRTAVGIKSPLDIVKLADQKLAAAKSLVETGHFHDAYYLAGYSVELYLKAMICKTLKLDDFFELKRLSKENYRVFRNHDYEVLLVLSGLKGEFEAAKEDVDFIDHWNLVKYWNEGVRYSSEFDPEKVKEIINSIEKICIWISNHL